MLACLVHHFFKLEVKQRWALSRITMMRTTRETLSVPKYDVHLFPVVRFTVRGVEAESMEEACKKAEESLADEAIKSAMSGGSDHEADFDEEVIEALVDVQGDEDYSGSTWFKPAGDAWVKK